MIQQRALPDYYLMVLKIYHGGNSEILNYDYERYIGNTSKDEFTLDGEDDEDQEEEDSIEELVLILNESEKKPAVKDENQLIDEKLSYLDITDTEAVKTIIKNHPEVITTSFEDVRPSTVSVTYRFELMSDNLIYQKARRMSPSHNEIVRKEIDRMLSAGIITSVESLCTSSVVIATKEDVSPRFCVD